jgi:hypothetical protein
MPDSYHPIDNNLGQSSVARPGRPQGASGKCQVYCTSKPLQADDCDGRQTHGEQTSDGNDPVPDTRNFRVDAGDSDRIVYPALFSRRI